MIKILDKIKKRYDSYKSEINNIDRVDFLKPVKKYLIENDFKSTLTKEEEKIQYLFEKDNVLISLSMGLLEFEPKINVDYIGGYPEPEEGFNLSLYHTNNEHYSKINKSSNNLKIEDIMFDLKNSIIEHKVDSKVTLEDKANYIYNKINPFHDINMHQSWFNNILIKDENAQELSKTLIEKEPKAKIVNLYQYQERNPDQKKYPNKLTRVENLDSFRPVYKF